MKTLFAIAIIAVLISSCGWTPERSNPYDPQSDRYVEPPMANRQPKIDTLIVNTECINLPIDDDCGVIIKAAISDADGNLNIDSVIASINGRRFGKLAYDATGQFWQLKRRETELDSAAETYVGSNVQVTAIDDSGSVAQRSLTFPNLFVDYPTTNWPRDLECVCPDYLDFSWIRWNGQGQPRNYELRFYYANIVEIPQITISNISIADTFRHVTPRFEPADNNPLVFYGWRLFIYDQLGNSAGSEPKTFKYFNICTDSCTGP